MKPCVHCLFVNYSLSFCFHYVMVWFCYLCRRSIDNEKKKTLEIEEKIKQCVSGNQGCAHTDRWWWLVPNNLVLSLPCIIGYKK